MNVCGYYLTSISGLVHLPTREVWESPIRDIEEEDIELVTEKGTTYVYEQFERQVLTLTFILTEDQLTEFENMRATVTRQPFYFLLDIDDPSNVYYVRRSAGFKPKPLGVVSNDGQDEVLYSLTMELKTEVSAQQLDN